MERNGDAIKKLISIQNTVKGMCIEAEIVQESMWNFGLIFGRSGSGTTTLLQFIVGLSKPTSGSMVRNCIRSNVEDVELAAVPCGFGNAIGNKIQQGGVGLRMRICGQIICFVNYHFSAHLDVVNRCNDCTLSS
ncbi:unnamed protein product [Lactuca saligna]|uniref:Inositol polyphosphate-related phosphatase domain-containing protein n=1 Tax=Lactuca saligna TaxID=75948 RepID=A0AA36E879_LACSI|nr:unnamed protein product [Lactuca saligna]